MEQVAFGARRGVVTLTLSPHLNDTYSHVRVRTHHTRSTLLLYEVFSQVTFTDLAVSRAGLPCVGGLGDGPTTTSPSHSVCCPPTSEIGAPCIPSHPVWFQYESVQLSTTRLSAYTAIASDTKGVLTGSIQCEFAKVDVEIDALVCGERAGLGRLANATNGLEAPHFVVDFKLDGLCCKGFSARRPGPRAISCAPAARARGTMATHAKRRMTRFENMIVSRCYRERQV